MIRLESDFPAVQAQGTACADLGTFPAIAGGKAFAQAAVDDYLDRSKVPFRCKKRKKVHPTHAYLYLFATGRRRALLENASRRPVGTPQKARRVADRTSATDSRPWMACLSAVA
ncbi:hypothetical protein DPPLL_21360 [Desulfofustis limnaeus]|uniref:Transposase n=1 Tax=Desulfofustis limnaeus TaxID=2740163 RepID=A0ABM7W9W4_9BACT|nr:hypothetical protein DPPLL_21360 [Desulfofustis limnaeus]